MEEIKEKIDTEGNAGGADEADQQKEKLFTQEQVNEIVRKRLAKVKEGQTEPPEDYTAKLAEATAKLAEATAKEVELVARENRMICREYITEQGYPLELLEACDTSDIEKFKEQADRIHGAYRRKDVQPFGSAEFDGYGVGTIKEAFAPGRKHKPDTSAIGR